MFRTAVLTASLALCLLATACQPSAPSSSDAPSQGRQLKEAATLRCPENTQRVEKLDTMFPEVFCVGKEGRQGPWLEFADRGWLKTKAHFEKDKMHGEWTSYHANGQIDSQGQMAHNERVGTWKQWYVDATLRSVKEYKNDRLDGDLKLYYRSGALMVEGQYKEDLEEGPWKVYTAEGKLARECRMEDGNEKDCIIHIKDFDPAHPKAAF